MPGSAPYAECILADDFEGSVKLDLESNVGQPVRQEQEGRCPAVCCFLITTEQQLMMGSKCSIHSTHLNAEYTKVSRSLYQSRGSRQKDI